MGLVDRRPVVCRNLAMGFWVPLQWDKMHHRKEPKKFGTIPINWFKSVFKITGCADGFEKNLRLLPITSFSDSLVKPVPNPTPALARGLALPFLFLVAFAGAGFASTLTALKACSRTVGST